MIVDNYWFESRPSKGIKSLFVLAFVKPSTYRRVIQQFIPARSNFCLTFPLKSVAFRFWRRRLRLIPSRTSAIRRRQNVFLVVWMGDKDLRVRPHLSVTLHKTRSICNMMLSMQSNKPFKTIRACLVMKYL